jgi:hypothetical protein
VPQTTPTSGSSAVGPLTDDEIRDSLGELRGLYAAEESEIILDQARDLWERVDDAPVAALGECWRIAMLAATKTNHLGAAAAWRARARSTFARSGCQNGTAMAMLPDFFVTVRDCPEEPAHALAILDAMTATAGGSDFPLPAAGVRSSCLEKRGFLQCKIGAATADRDLLRKARDDYEASLALTTDDFRRSLKLRAALTSVDFLLADTESERRSAIDALGEVVDEADRARDAAIDVLRIGRANLSRMSTGEQGMEPYEVL